MKRILLLITLCVSLGTARAQSWKLVVSKTDGSRVELMTSDV